MKQGLSCINCQWKNGLIVMAMEQSSVAESLNSITTSQINRTEVVIHHLNHYNYLEYCCAGRGA